MATRMMIHSRPAAGDRPLVRSIAWKVLNGINERCLHIDRRTRFRDLARIRVAERIPASPIINFFSSVDNIGNYLPLLGIRDMLGVDPDAWNIHDKNIDFDFINRHYKAAIIGGAGLLDRGFNAFWDRFARECRVPAIIWGVGLCAPDGDDAAGVDRAIFARARAKIALVNLRDDLTAEYYGVQDASITPCPTIAYTQQLSPPVRQRGIILYASHEELVRRDEKDLIRARLRQCAGDFVFTDNIQRPLDGLEDIVRRRYCRSRLVVTTRLHGAITAYGLGIPYLAIARDAKLRAFQGHYGNGRVIEDTAGLAEALRMPIPVDRRIKYREVRQFGDQAKAWLDSVL
jgi:hypothetical protein